MEFTRVLKKGMSCEDVLHFKQRLLTLGFYADHITSATHKTYGTDTREAVERFQQQAGLTVDGIVGEETRSAAPRRTYTRTRLRRPSCAS